MAARAQRITRANCRVYNDSDRRVAKHVAILEQVAAAHKGFLPPVSWLLANHPQSYHVMMRHPADFKHIKTNKDKGATKYGKGPIMKPAPLSTLAEYNIKGALLNPMGLEIEQGTSESDWLELGRAITHFNNASKWWVGDWIRWGERNFGKCVSFNLAQQATGYEKDRLYEYVRIAKKFPAERRVAALPWSLHLAVERCEPDKADELLRMAVELGLSYSQVREMASGDERPNRFNQIKCHLKMSKCTYDRLRECAKGHEFSWYMANILDAWLDANYEQEKAKAEMRVRSKRPAVEPEEELVEA
jgi:hypothetical protein